MAEPSKQLNLFREQPLNVTYTVKRTMRLDIANCGQSRPEVVDLMNALAAREGMRNQITANTIDNWCKDSAPDRLPSLPWLVIFCEAVGSFSAIGDMLRPLSARAVTGDEERVLQWGLAEIEKRRAAKKARLAAEALEI